jgi:leucyl-tRNA synthetase
LKNCKLDKNTALIGHSFGGIVALRLLERGVRVQKVILLCTPYSGKFLDKKARPSVTAACKKGFDFQKIRKGAEEFCLLYDTADDIVPISDGEAFAQAFNVTLNKVQGQEPHLSGKEEPRVLEYCLATITVFTTRPDTLFGATYLVLAPEHPLVQNSKFQIPNSKEIEQYVREAKKKTEQERISEGKEKTGVKVEGITAVHPFTGEELPIWVADYVLASYGTGAIMGVPAHDERDFAFAKKFWLPIKKVISQNKPEVSRESAIAEVRDNVKPMPDLAYEGYGVLVNSGMYTGMSSQEARKKIADDLLARRLGRPAITYRLRDWVISRQRYWGVPIPIIHCAECGVQPIPEKDFPVLLPDIKDYKPKGDGKSPLAKAAKWVKVKCPKCKRIAERETDTMDTFVDSSWYFLRYTDPKNKKEFASPKKMKNWMPVNLYSGGAEHTTMHLLYSRFFIKVLFDLGLVAWDEPYVVRKNRGIILGPDGQKMSKSRGNVVDPDEYVRKLGADTVRMYLAFIGPYNEIGAYPWDFKGIMGIRRFVERIWRIMRDKRQATRVKRQETSDKSEAELERLLHKTVKKVGEDIEQLKFNTAIAAMMILAKAMEENLGSVSKKQKEIFLRILAPFAPHLAEGLWRLSGHKTSIHKEPWPKFDARLVEEEQI